MSLNDFAVARYHFANIDIVSREGVDDMRIRVKIGYGVLIGTYIATESSILLGCQPFHRNWQINPDPGSMFFQALHHKPSILDPQSSKTTNH